MRALSAVMLSLILTVSAFAHATYTGYSSAPGTRGTCASSCHGATGGTVQVSGFPTAYTPGTQYTITLRKLSGSTIMNFNSSVRIGTGSQNAGTISAGTLTAVYNATGETNGVHMSSTSHDSASFHWTAPAAGTGTVTLYVAAHQGSASGANTRVTLTASEAASSVPEMASAPVPQDQSLNLPIASSLSWTAGAGATSHDVYFGTGPIPSTIGNQTTTSYTPAAALLPGTTYYWRIDERNDAGVTPGTLWQFTTLPLPGTPGNPNPVNNGQNIVMNCTLSWSASSGAAGYDVYFGTENPPALTAANIVATSYQPMMLMGNMNYYWKIVARNSSGTTDGPVWQFRTEAPNGVHDPGMALPTSLVLGPVYPNPFNAVVTVPFVLPQAADVNLTLYDINGRLVASLVQGTLSAGDHQVQWSSAGFGSGIYLLRLTAAGKTMTTKIVALK